MLLMAAAARLTSSSFTFPSSSAASPPFCKLEMVSAHCLTCPRGSQQKQSLSEVQNLGVSLLKPLQLFGLFGKPFLQHERSLSVRAMIYELSGPPLHRSSHQHTFLAASSS